MSFPTLSRNAAKPQPNEPNHGFHGSEVDSDYTASIRAIRAIRGKIFEKMSDSGILHCKDGKNSLRLWVFAPLR
jgi:hypothetical protein